MNGKSMAAILAFVLVLAGAGTAASQEAEPEQQQEKDSYALSISAGYAGRYVWRGLVLNPDPAFQPGVEISKSGITLGAWASFDLTDYGRRAGYGDEQGNATEIDYYGSYALPLGDKAEFSSGFFTYTFPNTGYETTTEIFQAISFDVPASPTLTNYLDLSGTNANYTEFSLAHSFELAGDDNWGLALDLGARVGYANENYFELYVSENRTPNWSDWSASVALPVTMPGGFTFTPTGVYSSMIGEENRRAIAAAELDPDNWLFLATLSWETEF